jgi:hypothetical protein
MARGGFPAAARALFALLAGCALLATLLQDRDATLRAARSPVVLCLGAIAVLSAASVLWTVGETAGAVRYGLVVAGYGALATSAAVISQELPGRTWLLATIAALAGASGLIGLIAAGAQEYSFGDRVGGSWEAGGLFEYGPANAMLQVAALPILLAAMAGDSRRLAVAAAAGAAIAGAVIGLSDSLYAQLAGLAVMALAVIYADRALGRRRIVALVAVVLIGASALGAHLVAGRYYPPCELGGDGARLGALAAILVVACAAWALVRSRLLAERASLLGPVCVLVAATALAAGGALADPEGACQARTEGVEPYAGLLHGRIALWEAAADAARDHPVLGGGADTYGIVSAPYQEGDHLLYAHNLPLELWTELGVAGAIAAVALYAALAALLLRARHSRVLWLIGPAVAGFALANLVDFPWHLAGAGAIWALALGVAIAATTPVNA